MFGFLCVFLQGSHVFQPPGSPSLPLLHHAVREAADRCGGDQHLRPGMSEGRGWEGTDSGQRTTEVSWRSTDPKEPVTPKQETPEHSPDSTKGLQGGTFLYPVHVLILNQPVNTCTISKPMDVNVHLYSPNQWKSQPPHALILNSYTTVGFYLTFF